MWLAKERLSDYAGMVKALGLVHRRAMITCIPERGHRIL